MTVRVDQYLSSDKNKNGDAFSATLSRPLVADGLIIAPAGAIVGGHVVEAKKAGRVSGVSHLQIALNTLTLADGQQIPVESGLTSITGNTSNGRDAGAIVATTATGAAIGAAADWGTGAAIGGGAGLAAGVVGVLLTRGRPTVIYPESRLTFRLAKPVTFSTEKAPQAFADARLLNSQQRADAAAISTLASLPVAPGQVIRLRRRITTTPLIGDRVLESSLEADTAGAITATDTDTAANQVCPLLHCQRFILRRTAGLAPQGIETGGFFALRGRHFWVSFAAPQ